MCPSLSSLQTEAWLAGGSVNGAGKAGQARAPAARWCDEAGLGRSADSDGLAAEPPGRSAGVRQSLPSEVRVRSGSSASRRGPGLPFFGVPAVRSIHGSLSERSGLLASHGRIAPLWPANQARAKKRSFVAAKLARPAQPVVRLARLARTRRESLGFPSRALGPLSCVRAFGLLHTAGKRGQDPSPAGTVTGIGPAAPPGLAFRFRAPGRSASQRCAHPARPLPRKKHLDRLDDRPQVGQTVSRVLEAAEVDVTET